jgi:hypothetical protein
MPIQLSKIEFNQNSVRICCPSMVLCEMADLGIWILGFWDLGFNFCTSAQSQRILELLNLEPLELF